MEVWTPRGLTTYYVLFFIDLKTRAVEIAGISNSPNEPFLAQIARNITDPFEGSLRTARLLICDRDTKYTAAYKAMLENAGVKSVLGTGEVECHERLGGLLKSYRRAA